jgi:hypothetical protein
MKHITWLLVIVTLALGCGRDKKAWARKIHDLVERAYACKDVACAKQVDEEIGKMIGSEEEGRNLDEGEPEYLFSSAERIRNRVAKLEEEQKTIELRKKSPLKPVAIFETSLAACHLAYVDLRDPVRANIEAVLAKVGATLPPDVAPDAKYPGGMFWYDEFVKRFGAAMDGKVPVADILIAHLVREICIVNFRYDAEKAKDPKYFGPTYTRLGEIAEAIDLYDETKSIVDAVRKAAPDKDVFALAKSTFATLRTKLSAR